MDPLRDRSFVHNVVSGGQLRSLGFGPDQIKHRVQTGRLFPLWRDVFAIGRADVTDRGLWKAATLACGVDAALSDKSAAALWGIRKGGLAPIHLSVPGERARHRGIRCHRRTPMPPTTLIDGIPVIDPLHTLVDLAAHLSLDELTTAINEADRLHLVDHEEFTALVESLSGRRGIRKLRVLTGSFTRTDSNLERRFLKLVEQAQLPRPRTQAWVEGLRVDFFWPELRLVVETDGLTYHRTPAQQTADRKRDQILAAGNISCLRFTNAQVREEPRDTIRTLQRVARLRQQRQ